MKTPKKPKRRRPSTSTLTQLLPREGFIEESLPALSKYYTPFLKGESRERIQAFLMWKTYLHPELLLIMGGEQWMSKSQGMSFFRMLRGAGCALPASLANHPDFETPQLSKPDCTKAVLLILGENIKEGNSLFFRQLADLLEDAPVMEDFRAFKLRVLNCLVERRFLYSKSDQAARGRNYLQRLLLALSDLLLTRMERLPTISEMRQAAAALIERPPAKRELLKALQAIGLAGVNPPVLEP